MHPPQSQPPPTADPRPLRVLVADDESMIVRALQRLLERHGHVVHTASDAYEALDLLDGDPFDAVLVDQRMPGGGPSVLARLDAMGFDGVAVLMTGGLATDPLDVSIGVHRLQKPFPFASVIPILEGRSSD